MKNPTIKPISCIALSIIALAVPGANATMIDLSVDPSTPPTSGTAYVLGAINPGEPASDADEATYVSAILGLALGGSGTVTIGPKTDNVYRSDNVFSGLPTSVTSTGSVDGTSDTITLTGQYEFLTAKYDDGSAGTEVWYIGNLAAGTQLVIPGDAFGTGNNQYGLSGTVLLGPEGNTNGNVPDGGSTLAMLGSVMMGFGGTRAWFSRKK